MARVTQRRGISLSRDRFLLVDIYEENTTVRARYSSYKYQKKKKKRQQAKTKHEKFVKLREETLKKKKNNRVRELISKIVQCCYMRQINELVNKLVRACNLSISVLSEGVIAF